MSIVHSLQQGEPLYCKKDLEFVPEELQSLWQEIYGDIFSYHNIEHAVYFFNSDPDYYASDAVVPLPKDKLCIINYYNNYARYYLYEDRVQPLEEAYFSLKDYICALENIAFL